jgi:hypothetical protein
MMIAEPHMALRDLTLVPIVGSTQPVPVKADAMVM